MNDLEQLKALLLGEQQQALAALQSQAVTHEHMNAYFEKNFAQTFAALSPEQQHRLLQDPVLDVISKASRNRNKERLSGALSPVLMPSIRESITQGINQLSSSIDLMGQHYFTLHGMRWRKEAKAMGVPFTQVVMDHMIEYRAESAYVIQRASGRMVARISNAALENSQFDTGPIDREAMGLIQAQIKDSAGLELSDIKKMPLGTKHLWLLENKGVLLACVIRGDAPIEVEFAMLKTLATIHKKHAQEVNEYDGLMIGSPIQMAIEPMVRFQATVEPKKSVFSPATLLMWVLGLLTLTLLGASAYGRWQQSMLEDNLLNQAGLVSTHISQKGWFFRSFTVKGLIDPLFTPKVAQLASDSHIDPARLKLDLQPYLSLDPALSVQRASKALAPPSSVNLNIDQNRTLGVTGASSEAWRAQASNIVPSLPYINGADFSGLQITESQELLTTIAAIEAGVIEFSKDTEFADAAVGSSMSVVALASQIKKLQTLAAQTKSTVSIKLFGFTNEKGTPQRNEALRLERAEVVKAALLKEGIDAALLQVTPTPEAVLAIVVNKSPLRVQAVVNLKKL